MRVIYISGSGRSGSTLLERVLHATAGCAAVGEFHCLWRLDAAQLACSCGQNAHGDEFWPAVLDRANIDTTKLFELRWLESRVSRSGLIARYGYDLTRLQQLSDVRRFLELQFALFEAISAISGREIIVDSSKAGPRAWMLACDPRVSLIHLYRAPSDVIASWRSRKFDKGMGSEMQRLSLVRATMDWWKVEYLARRLAARRPVRMVDYHDLCRSPRAVIDNTLASFKLPCSQDASWLGSDEVRPTTDYHSLNGNPDRFERNNITISLRQTDWNAYGRVEAAAIRGLGGALATVYPAPITAG